MIRTSFTRGAIASVLLACLAAVASAQSPVTVQKPFEPVSGQEGKDVVWVPTPQATVEKMLELVKLTPSDVLIDLGSGNGVTVITAAKKGATAIGVEFNPKMVALARHLAQEAGVSSRTTFVQGDLFEADLSEATVVTLFLLSSINEKLRPKLLGLKPGTRIASNTFDMGDWKPDATAVADDCESYCTALAWVVPAKVEGRWQFGRETLTLIQHYQELSGTLGTTPITAAKLSGSDISFTVGERVYVGRVDGDRMTGQNWSANRLGAASSR